MQIHVCVPWIRRGSWTKKMSFLCINIFFTFRFSSLMFNKSEPHLPSLAFTAHSAFISAWELTSCILKLIISTILIILAWGPPQCWGAGPGSMLQGPEVLRGPCGPLRAKYMLQSTVLFLQPYYNVLKVLLLYSVQHSWGTVQRQAQTQGFCMHRHSALDHLPVPPLVFLRLLLNNKLFNLVTVSHLSRPNNYSAGQCKVGM